ncbi:recombinase family protein [Sandaracinobacteroides hominis]|uniref:recombinase family protein n=1 Tax=Sandaracinobacteroides hominis TaxID=2780086 RepID=UPI0018F34324|nr:recombinase family protein [Sandaracinobacteroides hominis]
MPGSSSAILAHCASFNSYRLIPIVRSAFNTEPYESAINPFGNPECRSRLDRLSRDAEFLLRLQSSRQRFIAADNPDVNEMTVGLLAVIAQEERKAIAKRTKEALAAAKARGVRLGNPRGAEVLRKAGSGYRKGVESIKTAADVYAAELAPIIAELRADGFTSLERLATELSARSIQTPRGGRWHASSVRNLLARLERA